MGSGYARKKKEAKQLQEKFSQMQEKMKSETVEGTSGGGLVSITLNGDHQMTKIVLKPECVDSDDIEGLEDLIRVAYNDAAKKLEDKMPDMGGMGGLLPGF
ncbi:MAG: Nucleoid-associated protein YbaB [Chlamydiales bacterium]|nr:Nucleoid-associated protein YbaB [Chlamydiales bacterium]MCH9619944.1 Nucleoid-associated protein YbaB [Chlamydiales bacterium]MCH9622629.1 Nucleoid-associated protein YbaB [Chlamydiales bacterium]